MSHSLCVQLLKRLCCFLSTSRTTNWSRRSKKMDIGQPWETVFCCARIEERDRFINLSFLSPKWFQHFNSPYREKQYLSIAGMEPPNLHSIQIHTPTVSRTRDRAVEKRLPRASLVAQWLGICLPMQGTRVRALVWEDPTCHGATRPVSHNCWACASGACAPRRERPRWWEARAPRWGVAPACGNWRGPSHRNEDPTQP